MWQYINRRKSNYPWKSFIINILILLILFSMFPKEIKLKIENCPSSNLNSMSVESLNGEKIDFKYGILYEDNSIYVRIKIKDLQRYGDIIVNFAQIDGPNNISLNVGNIPIKTYINNSKINSIELFGDYADSLSIKVTIIRCSYILLIALVAFISILLLIKLINQKTIICKKKLYLFCVKNRYILYAALGEGLWGLICYSYRDILTIENMGFGALAIIIFFWIFSMNLQKKLLIAYFLLIMVVVFFAMNDITSFLTVDEERAINEQAYLSEDILRHWSFFNARTNYVIMGSFWTIIRLFVPNLNGDVVLQLSKMGHFIIGSILILGLIDIVVYKLLCEEPMEKKKTIFAKMVIFVSFMILPVFERALNNYNYDLFSIVFSLYTCVFILLAYQKKSDSYGCMGIVTGTLAVQEKSIASPYFYLAIITFILIKIQRLTKEKYNLRMHTLIVGRAFLTAYLTSFLTSWVVMCVLRKGDYYNISFADILGPEVNLFTDALKNHLTMFTERQILYGSTISVVFLILIFTIIFNKIYTFAKNNTRLLKIIHLFKAKGLFFICIICIFAIIIGIVYTYFRPYAYLYPIYEANGLEYFVPNTSVTTLSMHYMSSDYLHHLLKSVLAMYVVFVNSIPTSFLCLFIGAAVICKRHFGLMGRCSVPIICMITLSSILMQIGYGILNMEPNSRYQNVYVIVTIFLILIIILKKSLAYSNSIKYYVVLGIILGMAILETNIYGPSYSTFIPVWNRVAASYDYVVPGKMVIGWYGGWGEHFMQAGSSIEKYCEQHDIDVESISIYTNYHGGRWLNNRSNIVFKSFPGLRRSVSEEFSDYDDEAISISDKDFYVFTRWGLTWKSSPFDLPTDIEPIITIKYGANEEMWIYQGSQLSEFFDKNTIDGKGE
mgnify:CR=1 FL=1